jgi:hypothetical protein
VIVLELAMPSSTLPVLDYAGPHPREPLGWLRALGRFVYGLGMFLFLLLRVILLLAGFGFVIIGTLLLTLGGRRSAARSMRIGWDRFHDLCRLWASDLTRPTRRWWQRRTQWGVIA